MVKFLQLFEASYYSTELPEEHWPGEYNPWADDEYPIDVVVRDEGHSYMHCEGIVYEVDNPDHVSEVSVDSIHATEGNQFYQDQIERYIDYIQNGGIIQTFPVAVTGPTRITVDKVINAIMEWVSDPQAEEIYDAFCDQYSWPDWKELDRLNDMLYYNKAIFEYDTVEDFEQEGTGHEVEWEKLKTLANQIEEFTKIYEADDEEYHLVDMNHRFQACLKIGVKTVLVEPV